MIEYKYFLPVKIIYQKQPEMKIFSYTSVISSNQTEEL